MSHTSYNIHSRFLLSCLALMLFSGCTTLFQPKQPDYIEPITGMAFIHVAGGEFIMGYPQENEHESERPAHKVMVSDMLVGMHEVTFDQYDKFCDATGRKKPFDEEWGRGNRPVINVSWEDAVAFAEWLSTQSDRVFSLPSEAQWEYFAQTGIQPNEFVKKKSGQALANCDGCGSPKDRRGPAPVGTFPPNARGLYDTAGNVNEWCLDSFQGNYIGAPSDDRPWLSDSTRERIHRGGHWKSLPEDLRSFARDWAPQNYKDDYIGFRLVVINPANPTK